MGPRKVLVWKRRGGDVVGGPEVSEDDSEEQAQEEGQHRLRGVGGSATSQKQPEARVQKPERPRNAQQCSKTATQPAEGEAEGEAEWGAGCRVVRGKAPCKAPCLSLSDSLSTHTGRARRSVNCALLLGRVFNGRSGFETLGFLGEKSDDVSVTRRQQQQSESQQYRSEWQLTDSTSWGAPA